MKKRRKAPGPDGVTPVCLKSCADQLDPIFPQIFNRSLELCEVPLCFKCSSIIPVPKKSKITGLNDCRPVAPMSVAMKSFERLVLAYLKDTTRPLLDPCSLPTEQTGLWMMQSTWDYTLSCSIWTDQGLMWGSLWRVGRGREPWERSEAGGVIGNKRHLHHSPASSPTEELRKG